MRIEAAVIAFNLELYLSTMHKNITNASLGNIEIKYLLI